MKRNKTILFDLTGKVLGRDGEPLPQFPDLTFGKLMLDLLDAPRQGCNMMAQGRLGTAVYDTIQGDGQLEVDADELATLKEMVAVCGLPILALRYSDFLDNPVPQDKSS